jgi:hypothetical protein
MSRSGWRQPMDGYAQLQLPLAAVWVSRRCERSCDEAIAVNARFAAGEPVTGPPDREEAERLLVVMEREGWLRYQLVRDGEPPPQSSPG